MLIEIPGAPAAQPRTRVTTRGGFAKVYEAAKSREVKAYARDAMVRALHDAGKPLPLFAEGPVRLSMQCVFELPASKHRKTPVPQSWHCGKRFDVDNLAKIYMDAATGVLWSDDGQVVSLVIRKIRGAQGEAPKVMMAITRENAEP